MNYRKNNPRGLIPVGHITGNVYNPFTSTNKYTLDPSTPSLQNGDGVIISPKAASYPINMYYPGDKPMVRLYLPVVTIHEAGNRATITLSGCANADTPIHGVFQNCTYTPAAGGKAIVQEYWIAGTIATSEVIATIIDDEGVIYKTTLGTYTGSMLTADPETTGTKFNTMPAIQREIVNAWPTTSADYADTNPTLANSCVIGSNLAFLTGDYLTDADAGATKVGSLSTVKINNVLGGDGRPYKDNPQIANQGNPLGNPFGVSTFYACPAIQITNAVPAKVDGRNEPEISRTHGPLRLIGFVDTQENKPYAYGVGKYNGAGPDQKENPILPALGNYENTPFMQVRVMINNHSFNSPTISVKME